MTQLILAMDGEMDVVAGTTGRTANAGGRGTVVAARHAIRVTAEAAKKPWCRVFRAQAPDAGVVGWLRSTPATNDWIKAPGDGFIKPRVIAPIVFCTVVSGIAPIQDAGAVGRIGVTALIHLESVSAFALGFGPVAGTWRVPAQDSAAPCPMRRRTSIC